MGAPRPPGESLGFPRPTLCSLISPYVLLPFLVPTLCVGTGLLAAPRPLQKTSRGSQTRGRLGLDAGASADLCPHAERRGEKEERDACGSTVPVGGGSVPREEAAGRGARRPRPQHVPLLSSLRSGLFTRPYALRGDGPLGRSAASSENLPRVPNPREVGVGRRSVRGSSPPRGAQGREGRAGRLRLRSLWAGALSPARRRQDAGRGGPAHSMSPFSRPYALRGDGLLGRSAASSRNLPRVPNPREVGVGRRSVRESLPPRGAQGREGRAGRLRLRSLWAGALSPARRRQAAGRGGPAHSMRAPLSRTFQHVREGKARRRQGLDAAPAKGTRAGAMLSNALPLWTEREECV